jgi:hypothetical protein
MSDVLNKAINILNSGDKQRGRILLAEIVKREPQNEDAWFCLSTCVDISEQKEYCLKKVLSINSKNRAAYDALQILKTPAQSTPIIILPSQNGKGPRRTNSRVIRTRALIAILACAAILVACASSTTSAQDPTASPTTTPTPLSTKRTQPALNTATKKPSGNGTPAASKTPVPNSTNALTATSTKPFEIPRGGTPKVDVEAMNKLLQTAFILPVDSPYKDSNMENIGRNGDIMLEIIKKMRTDPNYIPDLNKLFPKGSGIFVALMKTSSNTKPNDRIYPSFSPKFATFLRNNFMSLYTNALDDVALKRAFSVIGMDIPGVADSCPQQTWDGSLGVWVIIMKTNYGTDISKLPPSVQSYLMQIMYYTVQSQTYPDWVTFISQADKTVKKCSLSGK